MKARRFFPAIATAAILALTACSNAYEPTGQTPELTSALEDSADDNSQDTQGQQGARRDNPLER